MLKSYKFIDLFLAGCPAAFAAPCFAAAFVAFLAFAVAALVFGACYQLAPSAAFHLVVVVVFAAAFAGFVPLFVPADYFFAVVFCPVVGFAAPLFAGSVADHVLYPCAYG